MKVETWPWIGFRAAPRAGRRSRCDPFWDETGRVGPQNLLWGAEKSEERIKSDPSPARASRRRKRVAGFMNGDPFAGDRLRQVTRRGGADACSTVDEEW